jgi:hypothetical protein
MVAQSLPCMAFAQFFIESRLHRGVVQCTNFRSMDILDSLDSQNLPLLE